MRRGKFQISEVKIEDVHIPKKDYPPSKQFPPDSAPFADLKNHMKKRGQLVPIFIDSDKVLFQGHYRLWAWQGLGEIYIKACMVENENEIDEYFAQLPPK